MIQNKEKKTELELVRETQDGCHIAFEELLNRRLGYINGIISGLHREACRFTFDELLTVSFFAFYKAVKGFSGGKGSLMAFAKKVIRNNVIQYKRDMRIVRLPEYIYKKKEANSCPKVFKEDSFKEDFLPSFSKNKRLPKNKLLEFREAVETLPPRTQVIIEMKIGGYSDIKISNRLKMNWWDVARLKKDAYKKIKEIMKK